MLEVQKFLLNYNDRHQALEELENQYHIHIGEYENDCIVLNYNQIESPRFNSLVDDCRGLILSWDFKKIYCHPFTRFYNFGEGGEKTTNFPINESIAFSKEDGTLLSIWFHPIKNIWVASTRKMAYAEGITSFNISFYDIVCEALGVKNINDCFKNVQESAKENTWIFELTSRMNRVVKHYEETSLFLLGVRSNHTHEYFNILDVNEYLKEANINFKLPKVYKFNSFDEIMNSMKELEELDEGYVCYHEKSGQRVKIKSPSYLAIHHLRDNGVLNPKKIAFLVFENEYSEYLAYFPEDEKYFKPYIIAHDNLCKDIINVYNELKHIESQKEFALKAIKYSFNSILFELRKQEKNIHEIFSKLSDSKKLSLLEEIMNKNVE